MNPKDPRACPYLECWGHKVAFTSPMCPKADDRSGIISKAKCHACWEENAQLIREGQRRQ
ncbi:hypothetical protein [Porcincola intestinalis]|uniref:Uncharacterized protein n=1 Tax=Porcincola intestinalis TaxID=2606632 RepID=A0A6L5X2G3_9FIRM|nr:hypothetical protein [Porcincola intestinalis]MSS13677.1 hypothetical protein [Porcincola intestinalis]